tara:strand:+ start:488 stop:691 length:204 start_codon:yes stop_codon:yes gene_type:complete
MAKIILVKAAPTKAGNQKRTRPSASVSVSWDVYDELVKLAIRDKGSVGKVIEGLCRVYAEASEKKHA